jgi:hypothetical protein
LKHTRFFTCFEGKYDDSFALFSSDHEVDGAIVFVHGFKGDPHETFYAFQNMTISHSTTETFWRKHDLFFFAYRSVRDGIRTSADNLMGFLAEVFPSPPARILSILGRSNVPKSLASLDSPRRAYTRLVLVGHSEGGLVIRKAVVLAEKQSNPVSRARVVLFAPAISGVSPAGLKGMLLKSGPGDWIVLPYLANSRAYRDMTSANYFNDVRDRTLEAREIHKAHSALWAKVVFGSEEDVVVPVVWPEDQEDQVTGHDHVSICKPTSKYDRPITFVAEN